MFSFSFHGPFCLYSLVAHVSLFRFPLLICLLGYCHYKFMDVSCVLSLPVCIQYLSFPLSFHAQSPLRLVVLCYACLPTYSWISLLLNYIWNYIYLYLTNMFSNVIYSKWQS